jgi:hypothetical protein
VVLECKEQKCKEWKSTWENGTRRTTRILCVKNEKTETLNKETYLSDAVDK